MQFNADSHSSRDKCKIICLESDFIGTNTYISSALPLKIIDFFLSIECTYPHKHTEPLTYSVI